MKKKHVFPVVNRSSRQILIGLEPEGDTVPLDAGEICKIELEHTLHDAALEVVIEDEVLSIYAMCRKRAVVSKSPSKE